MMPRPTDRGGGDGTNSRGPSSGSPIEYTVYYEIKIYGSSEIQVKYK